MPANAYDRELAGGRNGCLTTVRLGRWRKPLPQPGGGLLLLPVAGGDRKHSSFGVIHSRMRAPRQSGAEAFAMCAIDALGIPFLARQRAEVRSREAVNGEPVRVLVAPDRSARSEPAALVVIAGRTGDGPSASACCPHLKFVSDRGSAAELLAGTPGLQGEVLDLAEAGALEREIFGDLIGEDDPLIANSILYPELQRLLDRGAQLVEVLPEQEYREEHLPGALNIPLKKLDAETTADLDRRKAIVVYCWDAL